MIVDIPNGIDILAIAFGPKNCNMIVITFFVEFLQLRSLSRFSTYYCMDMETIENETAVECT